MVLEHRLLLLSDLIDWACQLSKEPLDNIRVEFIRDGDTVHTVHGLHEALRLVRDGDDAEEPWALADSVRCCSYA